MDSGLSTFLWANQLRRPLSTHSPMPRSHHGEERAPNLKKMLLWRQPKTFYNFYFLFLIVYSASFPFKKTQKNQKKKKKKEKRERKKKLKKQNAIRVFQELQTEATTDLWWCKPWSMEPFPRNPEKLLNRAYHGPSMVISMVCGELVLCGQGFFLAI